MTTSQPNLELFCFALRQDYSSALNTGDVFSYLGKKWIAIQVSNISHRMWLAQQSSDLWFEVHGLSRDVFVIRDVLLHSAKLNHIDLDG